MITKTGNKILKDSVKWGIGSGMGAGTAAFGIGSGWSVGETLGGALGGSLGYEALKQPLSNKIPGKKGKAISTAAGLAGSLLAGEAGWRLGKKYPIWQRGEKSTSRSNKKSMYRQNSTYPGNLNKKYEQSTLG